MDFDGIADFEATILNTGEVLIISNALTVKDTNQTGYAGLHPLNYQDLAYG